MKSKKISKEFIAEHRESHAKHVVEVLDNSPEKLGSMSKEALGIVAPFIVKDPNLADQFKKTVEANPELTKNIENTAELANLFKGSQIEDKPKEEKAEAEKQELAAEKAKIAEQEATRTREDETQEGTNLADQFKKTVEANPELKKNIENTAELANLFKGSQIEDKPKEEKAEAEKQKPAAEKAKIAEQEATRTREDETQEGREEDSNLAEHQTVNINVDMVTEAPNAPESYAILNDLIKINNRLDKFKDCLAVLNSDSVVDFSDCIMDYCTNKGWLSTLLDMGICSFNSEWTKYSFFRNRSFKNIFEYQVQELGIQKANKCIELLRATNKPIYWLDWDGQNSRMCNEIIKENYHTPIGEDHQQFEIQSIGTEGV